MNTLAIVIACGREEEIVSGTDTAFLSLGNRPVLAHSLGTLQRCKDVDGIVVAVSKDRTDSALQLIKRFGCTKVHGVVVGGVSRLSTLRTVYGKLPEYAETIIIHEASRPFLSATVIRDGIKAAKRYGCAIAAHRIPDAVKVTSRGFKSEKTLSRNSAWAAQTPQIFRFEVFEKVIQPTRKPTQLVDDESEWVGRGAEVHMLEAGSSNIKIRNLDDFKEVTALFRTRMNA